MLKHAKIPLFPLNLVALPKEKIPLHIFEEKYKKMITDCISNKKAFGIICIKDKKMANIGCAMNVYKVLKKYNNGEYDIICKGVERFKINKIDRQKDLWYAEVSFFNEDYKSVNKEFFDQILDKYLKILISSNAKINIQNEVNKKNSFDFTKNVILPKDIKQIFLNLSNENERLEFINQFLDSISIESKKMYDSQKNIYN
tara:strand:- start:6055 stop:6654 length:600 start_codon:yes stop_codon:yes gene_type:complete